MKQDKYQFLNELSFCKLIHTQESYLDVFRIKNTDFGFLVFDHCSLDFLRFVYINERLKEWPRAPLEDFESILEILTEQEQDEYISHLDIFKHLNFAKESNVGG